MFKELKTTMSKELKENMRSFSPKANMKKEKLHNRNSGVEKQ